MLIYLFFVINFTIKQNQANLTMERLQLAMQKKSIRNMLVQKENDRKNLNVRPIKHQLTSKIDRVLLVKKISNGEEKEDREVKFLQNSKEVRENSRQLMQRIDRLQHKFSVQPLSNTQQYCQLYAHSIIKKSREESSSLGSFLAAHDIDKNLRARMLDWMIEVVSSYKFTPKTYFASVQLMDRYFKVQGQRLPITRVHIIGVVSMLIATEMDEVFPLKIKTVYDKIVHKKIEKKDLIEMEEKITQKLDYKLNVWSFYDLALLKLHSTCQFKNEEEIKTIQALCQHIAKYIAFNYELYGRYSSQILADALLRAAWKIYGTESLNLAIEDRKNYQTRIDQQICLQLILDTVKGFKKVFSSLNNIFKFTAESTLMKVQEFFKRQ